AIHAPPDAIFLCEPLHFVWWPTPATTLRRKHILADFIAQRVVVAVTMLSPRQRRSKPRTSSVLIWIRICLYLIFAPFQQGPLESLGLRVDKHVIVRLGHAGTVVSWRVLRLPHDVGDESLLAKYFIENGS